MEQFRSIGLFLRNSLWLLPAGMGIVAVVAAMLLVNIRLELSENSRFYWLLYTKDPEHARELLSTLLSGMINMTALVVSITMVVLTLAAGQIGPRLIRQFMQDRVTQTVLGIFLADILFLLTVFRSINGDTTDSVPHVAVSFGTLLTVCCFFILLFFVHRLARSIVYDNVIQTIVTDLRRSVAALKSEGTHDMPSDMPKSFTWVPLCRDGYVQTINVDDLVRAAAKAGAIVRLHVRPGHFVICKGQHVAVHPAEALTEDLAKSIRKSFTIGPERTGAGDIEFGIRQMVEVATRALSPGLNDVFTALAAIDNLSASLAYIFEHDLEKRVLSDESGAARVIRTTADHKGIVCAAFDQIRQSGANHPAVLIRLVEAIERLIPTVTSAELRTPLMDELDMILEAGKRGKLGSRDFQVLENRYRQVHKRLAP